MHTCMCQIFQPPTTWICWCEEVFWVQISWNSTLYKYFAEITFTGEWNFKHDKKNTVGIFNNICCSFSEDIPNNDILWYQRYIVCDRAVKLNMELKHMMIL